MSDNIDYAELDKAVNEAIKSNQAAHPVAKSSAKPVVKNTTVPRPHGQFMDFVPRPAGAPIAKPVAHPVLKPAVKTTTTLSKPTHPVAKPAARPVAKPIARPVAKPVAAKPVAHPAVHRAVATHPNVSARMAQHQATVKPVAKTATKPVAKLATKPVATKPAEAAKPVVRKSTEEKTPNANNYSLGGRSPFLTDAKVEKHPLGKHVPETSSSALKSTKNTYSQKAPSKTAHAKKHIVTEAPKKHTGWLWALVVLLVIAAGGGLGYLAYILVFAGGF